VGRRDTAGTGVGLDASEAESWSGRASSIKRYREEEEIP
jgi:hypothetical protein